MWTMLNLQTVWSMLFLPKALAQKACGCYDVAAADEEQFEGRNAEDSDMRSEATGMTEEDLRPVKVS